jgi:ATPases involved in chromosome partitioning
MSCKIIALVNQKGGVGKTTTAFHLAHGLKNFGKRVLCIDMDPQASLTLHAGLDPDDVGSSIANGLHEQLKADQTMDVHTLIHNAGGLDFIPSNIELSSIENDLNGAMARELKLRDLIKPLLAEYDFILIDCPPSLGIFTINVLAASTDVIIPCKAEYLDSKGVQLLFDSGISLTRRYLNPDLEVMGVLLTMYSERLRSARRVKDDLSELPIFETTISRAVVMVEASEAQQDIFTFAPDHNTAKEYLALAQEVIARE